MNKKNKGLTLIELIIVIAILGIIAVIAIPNLAAIRDRSQINADIRSAEQIGKAVRMWNTDRDAAKMANTERDIPTDKVIWYADSEYVTKKFAGMEYYVPVTYNAASLKTETMGTYFITSVTDSSGVKKVVVGIDEKGDEDAEGNIVAKTLTVPADKAAVEANWYKDGSVPAWAYLEK